MDATDDLVRIRAAEGSQGNYDGDRNGQEGTEGEIEGLQETPYEAVEKG